MRCSDRPPPGALLVPSGGSAAEASCEQPSFRNSKNRGKLSLQINDFVVPMKPSALAAALLTEPQGACQRGLRERRIKLIEKDRGGNLSLLDIREHGEPPSPGLSAPHSPPHRITALTASLHSPHHCTHRITALTASLVLIVYPTGEFLCALQKKLSSRGTPSLSCLSQPIAVGSRGATSVAGESCLGNVGEMQSQEADRAVGIRHG